MRAVDGSVDVLIIGGGITGAAIARDAAMRGLSVILVEQGDFAGGTSSRTSKLIHGGLRYLEHGHLHLVFEACRERSILLRTAPHLVRPLDFLIPVYEGDPRSTTKVRAGLWLYDLLAAGRRIHPHRLLSAAELLACEPALSPDRLVGGALYTDCRMQDARLCVEIILDAERRGAVCRNGVRAERLLLDGGRVVGAVVRDARRTGEETIAACVVVNAAGPWADRVMRLARPEGPNRLRPTKGIHLVLPSRIGSSALLLSAQRDGRVIFMIPWDEQMLVGTTESAVTELPDEVRAEPDEVAYLLDEVNRVLAATTLIGDDVQATFAGLRPLVDRGGADPAAISREHVILEEPAGLLHVLGGKYTTHRAIAEAVVERVFRRLGRRDPGCRTAVTPLWSIDDEPEVYAERVVRSRDAAIPVSDASLHHLAMTYGIWHRDILAIAQRHPDLSQPLCRHHPHIGAEFLYACQKERARGLVDFAFRRTAIAYSPCHGMDGVEAYRSLLVRYLGWGEAAAGSEIAAYRAALADGLSWRGQIP